MSQQLLPILNCGLCVNAGDIPLEREQLFKNKQKLKFCRLEFKRIISYIVV